MARKNKSRHQRAKEKITTFVNQLRLQKDKHVLEIEKMKKEMNEIYEEKKNWKTIFIKQIVVSKK